MYVRVAIIQRCVTKLLYPIQDNLTKNCTENTQKGRIDKNDDDDDKSEAIT